MFENFKTENELRKIAAHCATFEAGSQLPALKEILRDFQKSQEFFDYAKSKKWRAREIALAVYAGILIQSEKDYIQKKDDEGLEAVFQNKINFLEMMVEKGFWYDEEICKDVVTLMENGN